MKIITTSWDDGSKATLKIADLLSNYKMAGTFYTPTQAICDGPLNDISYSGDFLNNEDIKIITDEEHLELGAHGVTHTYLISLSPKKARGEIEESKKILEELTERDVEGFAYPGGKYNNRMVSMVEKAGFSYARTTEDGFLHASERFKLPVSVFCSDTIVSRAKSTLLAPFSKVYAVGGSWKDCAFKGYQNLKKEGGVLHIAGHPQDLSEPSFKDKLEEVLSKISGDSEIEYLTNYQTVKRLEEEGYLE